ncbi:MAG: hypothetical protein L3J84_01665 [Gammaproteobacteria bacterium]|nr:hypothetical protein [Gammaproteobacteria bacterium]
MNKIENTPNAEPVEKESVSPSELEDTKWGELPADNFGYASDEERRSKRGLEDWELVEKIPESQQPVPRWFIGIIVAVMLVAVGLSFPFWGDRPGYEREWINWGFGAALLYTAVFGTFVYFMVNFYGSKVAGRLDSDKEKEAESSSDNDENNNENKTAYLKSKATNNKTTDK